MAKVTDGKFVYPPKPLYVPPKSLVFDNLDNDSRWIAEEKKDGWRMMVRVKSDRKIELWTRHKTLELSPLPGVRSELEKLDLPPDTILDGELLEHRGKIKDSLMLWGMIRWESKWTTPLPYKEIIWRMSFVPENDHLFKPKFVFTDKKEFYKSVIKEGGEGIVIKRLDASVPVSASGGSKKINTWIKVKPNA